MKTRYISAVSLLMAVAASCTVRELTDGTVPAATGGELITITATHADGDRSKTELDALTGTVLWSPGDKVKLFSGSETGEFTSTNTEPSVSAQFTGYLSIVIGSNEGPATDTYLLGMYPYREDAVSDGTYITTTQPKVQTARADDFAEGSFISVAKSGSFALPFYNVCGGIRFSLSQEGVTRVSIRSNGGEVLTGKVKIGIGDDRHPYVEEVMEGTDSLVLCAPAGETFLTDKAYCISILPVTMSDGFTLHFYADGLMGTRSTTKALEIKRSVVTNLGLADSSVEYKPVTKVPMTFSIETETKCSPTIGVLDGTSTDGSSNRCFTTDGASGTAATYEGFAAQADSYYVTSPYIKTNTVHSNYPYAYGSVDEEGLITVVLPSVQKPGVGNYDDRAFISIGQGTGGEASLQSLCGLVKFTLDADNIREVEFRGLGDEVISGVAKVGISDAPYVAQWCTPTENTKIKLVPAEGGCFAAGSYSIVVPPTLFEDGVRLTLTRSDGREADKTFSSSVSVTRNSTTDLGTVGAASLDWMSVEVINFLDYPFQGNIDYPERESQLWPFVNVSADYFTGTVEREPFHANERIALSTASGYTVYAYGTEYVTNVNLRCGMRMCGEGSYFELSGKEGRKIKKVRLVTTSSFRTKKYHLENTSMGPVEGGEEYTIPENTIKEIEWLPLLSEGEACRIIEERNIYLYRVKVYFSEELKTVTANFLVSDRNDNPSTGITDLMTAFLSTHRECIEAGGSYNVGDIIEPSLNTSKVEFQFTNGGYSYTAWATNSLQRVTTDGGIIKALGCNQYNPSWEHDGAVWCCGYPSGNAWLKLLAISEYRLTGITVLITGTELDTSKKAIVVCPSVTSDGESVGEYGYFADFDSSPSSPGQSVALDGVPAGESCYLCFQNSHSIRIRTFSLEYEKVAE